MFLDDLRPYISAETGFNGDTQCDHLVYRDLLLPNQVLEYFSSSSSIVTSHTLFISYFFWKIFQNGA